MSDTPSYKEEADEIARDAWAERGLVWRGVGALIVVIAIVVARELLLR